MKTKQIEISKVVRNRLLFPINHLRSGKTSGGWQPTKQWFKTYFRISRSFPIQEFNFN